MRIVSLLPSATEIFFAIGAGKELVGVTHECDFPEGARTLPKLTSSALPNAASSAQIDRHVRKSLHEGSSLYHLDADLLESLKPDLIVTQELCAVCTVSYEIVFRATKRVRHDHRLLSLEPSSLDDVLGHIELLGDLTGHRLQANATITSLRKRIDALASAPPHAKPPRVLVLEWTDPPMSGGHWTPGLVELAGAIPLLGNPGTNSRVLTWDEIAVADPDAIVVGPCGYDLEKTRIAVEELNANETWRSLRAYREKRVHAIDGNAYLNRPGPRLVDTAEIIARAVGTVPPVGV